MPVLTDHEIRLQSSMADAQSGGHLDGLEATGVNRNQGAESTLAYLWTEVLAVEVQRETNVAHTVPSALRNAITYHE